MDDYVYLLAEYDIDHDALLTITAWHNAHDAVAKALKLFNDQMSVLKPLLEDKLSVTYAAPALLSGRGDEIKALSYELDDIVGAVLDGDVVKLRQPYMSNETHRQYIHWYGVDVWKEGVR